jgi:hypothetical protein
MAGHLIQLIGTVKLAELKIRDVGFALGKLAKRLSTRSVRLARMILIQSIRNAMVNDLVVRNVRIWLPSRGRRRGRLPTASEAYEQSKLVETESGPV